jgi:hypothetical protein
MRTIVVQTRPDALHTPVMRQNLRIGRIKRPTLRNISVGLLARLVSLRPQGVSCVLNPQTS